VAWPELLVLLWPIAVLAWRWTLPDEVFSLSEDDFARTLNAWAVGHGHLFPTDVWPPGPAWLAGALVAIGVPMQAAGTAVNLAAITVALALAGDIARRLGAPAPARAAALVGVAMLRWPAWLGLSGLAEPPAALAFVALAHGLVRLTQPGARLARTEIALAAGLAALCRYESWVLVPAAAAILWTRRRGALDALGALAPLVVPLGWVALQWRWNGNLGFALQSRETLLSTDWRPDGVEYDVGLFTDLLEATGPLLPLALLGGWGARRCEAGRGLALLWAGTAAVYLVAGLLGFGGTHNPPRLWLGHALLLPAGTALALRELRPGWLAALVVGLGTVCLPSWAPPPTGYSPETATVALATRDALEGAPGARVLVEAVPWKCLAMKALVGLPDRVTWDRDPTGEPIGPGHPSALQGSAAQVAQRLAEARAAFVVTATPESAATLATMGVRLAASGEWALWGLTSADASEQGRILRDLREKQPVP